MTKIQVFERYLADSGYIGYCLGVPGAIFVHYDPNLCAEMAMEVHKALTEETGIGKPN